jgi:hypothetical protein
MQIGLSQDAMQMRRSCSLSPVEKPLTQKVRGFCTASRGESLSLRYPKMKNIRFYPLKDDYYTIEFCGGKTFQFVAGPTVLVSQITKMSTHYD